MCISSSPQNLGIVDGVVGEMVAGVVGNTGKAIVELSEQAKQVTGSNGIL